MRFFIIFIVFMSPAAHSAGVTIGTDVIEVPIPKGYCELSKDEPADSRLINYLIDANSGVNEVLLVIADCDQLTAWRNLELPTLNDYGYVMSPFRLSEKKQSMNLALFLSKMEAAIEKQGARIIDKTMGDVKTTVEDLLPEVKLNEFKNLGLVGRDEYALYLGILQNLQTEVGTSKNVLAMWGMTLVEGKTVNLYLLKEYKDEQSVDDLDMLTSTWVSNVHKAN